MGIKAKLLGALKVAELPKFPPAFWFGFWFVLGGYWGIVMLGAASDFTKAAIDFVLS